MSNFSGIKKSAKPFQPQGSGGPEVGIVRTVGGTYEPMSVVEVRKANEPVLPTDEPRPTDGKGENELGLSGQVSHPDNSGGATFLAQTIARVYRQTLAGRNADTLSPAERRALRDQIIDGVGSYGQGSAQQAVFELASLLAGLEDELSNTPDFLRAPKLPTSDDLLVGRIGADYLRLKAAHTGTLLKCAGTSISVYCPILIKSEALREVSGVIADESVDKSNEVFDYPSSEPFFRKWSEEFNQNTNGKSYGNVRSQHSANAVGLLKDIQFDSANKRIGVVAKIVDDDTWRKIQAGVLTGFSIGGKYLNKWSDGNFTRYTAVPAEVSVVDNPCNPSASFSMVKDAPETEMDKIRANIAALSVKITAHVKKMLADQGANLDELAPNKFPNVYAWREAIAKAQLARALENGVPASAAGDGDRTTSNFRPIGTGEKLPAGAAKHHTDLERKTFRPR